MLNSQLTNTLSDFPTDNVVCVKLQGSQESIMLKVMNVEDGDNGVTNIVVQPFANPNNYVAEARSMADSIRRIFGV